PERIGKAAALNNGIAAATSEILLFVDLRPHIPAGSIAHLVSNFADPRVGCVAGELVLSLDGQDSGAAAVGGMYWRYEQWIRDCEARFDSPLGVYGGYYAVRRSLAVRFPDGTILDDMYQPLAIVRQGYRSVLDRDAKVHDAWPKTANDEFRRKVRTLAGNYQLMQLAPWLLGPRNRLALQLWSHKWLRLLVPFCLPVVLIASVVLARTSWVFAVLSALQIIFYLAAWVGPRVPNLIVRKVSGVAQAFCMLNYAAAVALHRFLFTRGPLWQIWGAPQVTTAARAAGSGQ
ncbi:MAG: glycosyltransferase family 2 protein, partial [Acidobacteriales bacterium]|nr:glycosyltransferase family 2 protein [Terriglobales bacterium]